MNLGKGDINIQAIVLLLYGSSCYYLLFIFFLEKGKEKKKEGNIDVREKQDWLPFIGAPTGDQISA